MKPLFEGDRNRAFYRFRIEASLLGQFVSELLLGGFAVDLLFGMLQRRRFVRHGQDALRDGSGEIGNALGRRLLSFSGEIGRAAASCARRIPTAGLMARPSEKATIRTPSSMASLSDLAFNISSQKDFTVFVVIAAHE